MQLAIADFFLTVVYFIIVLGALIVVHEFGHFIVAKKSGVRVERFSIGFGRPLWRKEWRGTEYQIALVPLGGYVKMYGEQLDEAIGDPRGSFLHQSVWKRIPIVAAGSGFNLLLAIVLIAFIHVVGVPVEQSVRLGDILPNTPAAHAGLQADDIVIAVDGKAIQRIDALRAHIMESKGALLLIQVNRAGQMLTIPVTPQKDPKEGEWRIGVKLLPGDIRIQQSDPLTALAQGVTDTWRISQLILQGFGKILARAIPLEDSLAGPLGIAHEISNQAKYGWRNVVFFAAGISINLAIFNLLPIPVLDGGHLLFFMFEIIQGKPLSMRARELAQRAGLLVLVALMLLALLIDVRKFIQ